MTEQFWRDEFPSQQQMRSNQMTKFQSTAFRREKKGRGARSSGMKMVKNDERKRRKKENLAQTEVHSTGVHKD